MVHTLLDSFLRLASLESQLGHMSSIGLLDAISRCMLRADSVSALRQQRLVLTLHGSFDLHPTHALAALVVIEANSILYLLNLKSSNLPSPDSTSLLTSHATCHRLWCRPLS